MKTYSRLTAPELIRQLDAAGVLTGGAQDTAITSPARPGLLICQVGGLVESSAFDLDGGYGAGFIIPLHIAVDQAVIRIWAWRLDLPWEDSQFQWVTDPSEYASEDSMYQIPGCARLKYPRDEVLNHRKVLQRGHSLDGQLLGWGFESIPESYQHGAKIDAGLVLIDELGRDFSTPIQLRADRSAKICRKQRKVTTRRSLFDKPDRAKGDLIQK
jgi:hypothetical protein